MRRLERVNSRVDEEVIERVNSRVDEEVRKGEQQSR